MEEPRVPEYDDRMHAEVLDDLEVGEHGYKYRLLDGVVMPPYITPARYQTSRTIETRLGDLCYTSFPKSGSTWLAYVLVLLVHGGDVPDEKTLRDCLQWVASSYTYPRSREELDALPSPRIFKSHMPYPMALGGVPHEGNCRYVYIARNPKDVAVSYFHFERDKSWTGGYSGPWEHWLEMFLTGQVQRGDWFDHVLSWWEHRDHDNILFLKYEDLKSDFSGELSRMARFFDLPLSPEIAAKIADHTAFGKMKSNSFSDMHEIAELGAFFRKGTIGSWRERFTDEQNARFDAVYAERMAGSGLDFDFS